MEYFGIECCGKACNVGLLDRLARLVAGLVFAGLGLTVSPWFYILTAIAWLTAAFGFCPIYSVLGMSTCEKHPAGQPAGKPVKAPARKAAKRKRR